MDAHVSDIRPGMRWGKLTAIEPCGIILESGFSRQAFLCRCDCGQELKISIKDLRLGRRRSCGCTRRSNESLKGRRFGEFKVLDDDPSMGCNREVLCECNCGTVKGVRRYNLLYSVSKDCGCSKRTHGMTGTPEYRTWAGMINRCTNPNEPGWDNYGGRGITVCPEWRNSFEQFFADMGPKPSPGFSLDRVDNNKGYSPSNCRWADPKTQARNTRKNRFVNFNGKRMTWAEAAETLGFDYYWFKGKLQCGVDIKDILLLRDKEEPRP